MALLQRQAELRAKLLSRIQAQLEAGAISGVELNAARLALIRARAELAEAQRLLTGARSSLAGALGLSAVALDGLNFEFDLAPPTTAEDLTAHQVRKLALLGRVDILAALSDYAASQSALQLEVAKQYPDIHLAPGYFWGAHDGRHSVYFLFEFDRVIQDGIFYPRWLPDFTFGYGYPFFNIYGPGAFYIGETLHLIGFDFVTATKIVFGAAMILSGVTMFGFVKRLTGSSQAAFLSGLAYVYIPYHIADLYVRAALEESVALVFLPLAVWGFYETVVNPRRTTIVATAKNWAPINRNKPAVPNNICPNQIAQ